MYKGMIILTCIIQYNELNAESVPQCGINFVLDSLSRTCLGNLNFSKKN